jgi:hypothetical protein
MLSLTDSGKGRSWTKCCTCYRTFTFYDLVGDIHYNFSILWIGVEVTGCVEPAIRFDGQEIPPSPLYGARMFSIIFAKAHTRCCPELLEPNSQSRIHFFRSILILSSHLCLNCPSDLFFQIYGLNLCVRFSVFATCYRPRPPQPVCSDDPDNIVWGVKVMQFSHNIILYS